MNDCSIALKIWKENSIKVKAFICSKVKHQTICEDILHDVFIKITQQEERIKWIKQPTSYLIKMAQNAIVDFCRTQKIYSGGFSGKDYIIPKEELSEIKLADCCLIDFIKKLPPIYSEAIILTSLNGMSQKQFAEKLNLSYTAAKSRVQRGRKMLKESILNCCPYQFDKYGNIIDCCK